MGSKKRSAWARQKAEFNARLGGSDGGFSDEFADVFAAEDRRRREADVQREAALREKACASKNRYTTLAEAQENIAWCERQGTRGLHAYRCPYCDGWHLTSKPAKR